MRLEHFQYIVAIAECHSLSKAARDLFITQPTLSVNLQNLETELGFPLFTRSHRGMELTEKGMEFYRISKRILEELNRIQRLSAPADESVEINLAAVPAFCNAAMMRLLADLRQEEVEIILNIKEAPRGDVYDMLVGGEVSMTVGICVEEEEQQLYQDAALNHIMIEPLVHDRMYAYIPKQHPLSHDEGVSLESLAQNDILLLSERNAKATHPSHTAGKYYSFTERDSVMKAISKGLGYAILPGLMVMDNLYVETGLVSVVPLTDGVIHTTMYLGYSAAEPMTNREKIVARHIRMHCREMEKGLAKLPTIQAASSQNKPSIYY